VNAVTWRKYQRQHNTCVGDEQLMVDAMDRLIIGKQ